MKTNIIEKVYLIFFLYNSRLNKILYKQEKASMPNLMIQCTFKIEIAEEVLAEYFEKLNNL